MPFTSLKRKLPASDKRCLSLDEFIDDAENYAAGRDNVFPISNGRSEQRGIKVKKINATFSLTPQAKQKLDRCSRQTGISRSRLIRIWLDGLDEENLDADYSSSAIE